MWVSLTPMPLVAKKAGHGVCLDARGEAKIGFSPSHVIGTWAQKCNFSSERLLRDRDADRECICIEVKTMREGEMIQRECMK